MTSNKPLEYITTHKHAYIYFNFSFTLGSEVEWRASFNWDLGHDIKPTPGSQGYSCQVKADRLMRRGWTASFFVNEKRKEEDSKASKK